MAPFLDPQCVAGIWLKAGLQHRAELPGEQPSKRTLKELSSRAPIGLTVATSTSPWVVVNSAAAFGELAHQLG